MKRPAPIAHRLRAIKEGILKAKGEYVVHGGDHPGTKSAEDDATRRKKRKAAKAARKKGR